MSRRNTMSVTDAAKIMEKTPQYVRLGLQQERLPIGSAVQKNNGRWSYNIITVKVYEYMGRKAGE